MPVDYIKHGDCRDLLQEIPTESIDLLVTDCPYKLISGGCTGMHGMLSGKENPEIKSGGVFLHNDIKFSEWLSEVYRVLKNGTHAYIMVNGRNVAELQNEAEKCGFKFVNLLVWEKNNVIANRYYMYKCEFILLLRKGKARTINHPGTANIFHINNISGKKLHPAQKPEELIKLLIENSSNEGDVILDPFMGVGTTCIVCLKTKRHYIGFDIDERYFKIAEENLTMSSIECDCCCSALPNEGSPVICAECRDTGTIVTLKDGNHLTCALCDDKPIWGSKPKWCPKQEREQTYEQMVLPIIPEV